ncbi:MAG: MBL fold metallo-hydrolase [Candidatus Odinarchaeota archaeon]
MNDFIQAVSEEFKEIKFIKGARNGKYPFSHSLLIDDFLIDTGISSRLLRKLKRIYPINKVILSHWHEDHIHGNRLLRNAKFYIHPEDKFLIENVDKFYEYYGVSGSYEDDAMGWLMQGLRYENTRIEKTIEDNEIIKIGKNYDLKVLHTPGHTAGHCSFYELNSKIGFLADIDLTKFVFYGGVDSNLIDFERSIKKLKEFEMNIAITGHRGVIRGSKEVKTELDKYQSIIDKADERILSYLSETNPKSVVDLKNKNLVYKYYSLFKDYELIAEMIMIQKHFDKFIAKGFVEQIGNGYILS